MSQLPFQPPDEGGPAPPLRLFRSDAPPDGRAQDSEKEHGITDPVRTPAVQPELEIFRQLQEEHSSGPPTVPDGQRIEIRQSLTLQAFYDAWMAGWRQQQLAAGDVSPGTLSKERQALRRFAKWEQENPPENWPADREWRGCPIGFLQGGYFDRFYAAISPPKYAANTVVSTRNHLRTVLNHAAQIGALESAPQPRPLDLDDPDDVDEDLATVWTADEIDAIYQSLAGTPDLQTAFVININAGPRSSDIFRLRWEKNVRLSEQPPMLRFRSKKAKKKHGIPLAPVTVAHLQRLQAAHLFEPGGPVFPRLVSLKCKDPERSRAARRRNQQMKKLLEAAGVPVHDKPWQVGRASCCTRYNDHKGGVGSWVIGQGHADRSGTKLAANFYDNPTEDMARAILSAPQPISFLSILK